MRIRDWSSDVCSSDLSREQAKTERVEPEDQPVAGSGEMGREEDRDRHENAHAEVLRKFDPEDRMSVQDEVAYGVAANAGHGSETHESDDVHLIARGDQCACNREDHDAEPDEQEDAVLKH